MMDNAKTIYPPNLLEGDKKQKNTDNLIQNKTGWIRINCMIKHENKQCDDTQLFYKDDNKNTRDDKRENTQNKTP